MKNLLSWIYKNFILSILLGTQAIVLLFLIGWLGVNAYNHHFPKKKKELISIYSESSLKGDIQWEIEQYENALSANKTIQLESLSQEELIQKFIGNETKMIFISRQLVDNEISQIESFRLPISQQEILVGSDSIFQMVYLVHDNNYPEDQKSLANVLLQKKEKILAKL